MALHAVLTPVVFGVLLFVTLLFIVSLVIKRNDIADVAWGPGIALVALVAYIYGVQDQLSLLVTVLVMVWALRLATHIGFRNLKKPEDRRYAKWRDEWSKRSTFYFLVRSYFQVFLLQGLLMIIVGYGAIHAATFGGSIGNLAFLGLSLWLLGFFFEMVGDYQLKTFLGTEENKGKIMRFGLWRYTRHPNYFGEVTLWWGVWFIVLSAPFGLYAVIAPVTITILILGVSGIPMTERGFLGNPEFEAYKRKTSAFFPLPSKK